MTQTNNHLSTPPTSQCLQEKNVDDTWTQATSPWNTPQDCIWPLDSDNGRVCSVDGTGMHTCNHWDASAKTWCGSAYDWKGNMRFISSLIPYDTFDRVKDGEFDEGLAWGFTSYDNIFRAFTSTFQAVSQEGWTGIMYQTIDSWSTVPSVIIFVLLILIGGNIVLNLVLAVITSSLDEDEDDEEEAEEEKEENAEEVKVYAGLEGKTDFLVL